MIKEINYPKYTLIPTEIINKLWEYNCSELKILLVLIDENFNSSAGVIIKYPANILSKITGESLSNIKKAIKTLEEKDLIYKEDGGYVLEVSYGNIKRF
jgi:DNA-binding MarR family transcriptional regulator